MTIAETRPETAVAADYPTWHSVSLVLDSIAPSPLNPRKRFEPEALAELAASIREHGVIQPIVVRPNPDRAIEARYTIVAGERRWRAAQLAGLDAIPATIREDLDDVAHLKLAIVENLQRRDLDPIEEAEGYRQLQDVVGLTQTQIAGAVNRSQSSIARSVALLGLPEDVRCMVTEKHLSAGHAAAIARYNAFPELASALAKLTLEYRWTVRNLEAADLLSNWEVQRTETVHRLDYDDQWLKPTCEQCPFGAFRAARSTEQRYNPEWGYCLKPAHLTELNAAREAEKKEEMRAAAERLRAQSALARPTAPGEPEAGVASDEPCAIEPPKYSDLPYGTVENLSYSRPTGCTTGCPCHGFALDAVGKTMPICMDPKRLAKLKAADQRAKNKAARERQREAVERVEKRLDVAIADTARELAVIVSTALPGSWRGNDRVTAAAARYLPADVAEGLAKISERYDFQEGDRLDLFASVPAADLIRFAVHAILGQSLYEAISYNSAAVPVVAAWYAGADEPSTEGEATG